VAQIRRPVDVELSVRLLDQGINHVITTVQFIAVILEELLGVIL